MSQALFIYLPGVFFIRAAPSLSRAVKKKRLFYAKCKMIGRWHVTCLIKRPFSAVDPERSVDLGRKQQSYGKYEIRILKYEMTEELFFVPFMEGLEAQLRGRSIDLTYGTYITHIRVGREAHR